VSEVERFAGALLKFIEGVLQAVSRCPNCGGEIEEGKGFCPHCGKAAAAGGADAARVERESSSTAAPRVVNAPSFGRPPEEKDGTRRVIFIAVGVIAALLVAGLAYLASRPSAHPGEEKLAGAIRPGSHDYPASDRLVVEFDPDENAEIGPTALGTWSVMIKPTVRNFTGRTVNGLEFHASGVDLSGNVIRERTFVSEAEIEPNKIFVPSIGMSFPQDNKPANLKLELTGVRFK
jgi:hypothetical protein